MTAIDASTIVLRLRTERAELELLNRTVTHCLCLASDRELLPPDPKGQHVRRVPSTWGIRRDTFFWDSWDWKLRGEDDLRRFFEIAQRLGGCLSGLEQTEAANLLPGTVEAIVGRRTDLYLPDYWLFVVQHLGWTDQLPYECELHWSHGQTFSHERYGVTSRLPVNIVQASIDALTVLIDATPHRVWDQRSHDFMWHEPSIAVNQDCDPEAADDPPWVRDAASPNSTVNLKQQQSAAASRTAVASTREERPRHRKRADRAANIEALKKELIDHIRAARDHAQSAVDFGREAELLPRPSRRELAERVGITESAASRCFSDPAATELNLLWTTADDLKAVLKFVRH